MHSKYAWCTQSGPRGPTLSTHQHAITSAFFKETDGRILIYFYLGKANTLLF